MTPVITAAPRVRAALANVASDSQCAITGLRSRRARPGRGGAGSRLRAVAVGRFDVAGLAAAAGFGDRRRLVRAAGREPVAAALEAAIPAAAVMAVAWPRAAPALRGRSAARARLVAALDRGPGRGDPEAGP